MAAIAPWAMRIKAFRENARLPVKVGGFLVRPAWAVTWRWKSATRLAVGSVSQRQGCPPWGGIWRKPEAKSRADEQKPHIRQCKADEFAKQNEVLKTGLRNDFRFTARTLQCKCGGYMGWRLLTLTWGGLDGKHKVNKPEQPIQRCMAERPEVSRGHSTVKGNVPLGSTNGTGRAEQWVLGKWAEDILMCNGSNAKAAKRGK
jgi:hypothetical protein